MKSIYGRATACLVVAAIAGAMVPQVAYAAPAPSGDGDGVVDTVKGWFADDSRKLDEPPSHDELDVAERQKLPKGKAAPKAKRVGELTGRRTANARYWRLSDGRVQAEVSAVPTGYRSGRSWKAIDPTVVPSEVAGFPFANTTNAASSWFGSDAGRLLRFEAGDGHVVTLGLQGGGKLSPLAKGDTVTYKDAVAGADLTYQVGPGRVKENIVLDRKPAGPVSFSFTLDAGGLTPKGNKDGSVSFFGEGADPVLVIPAAFMTDAKKSAGSAYGTGYSPAVTQKLSKAGKAWKLTVTPDAKWLAAPERQYPVTIDPTISIAPTPATAQDVMISSDGPTTNYKDNWRLSVGNTTTGTSRALLRFPLTGVPSGTKIDSADLKLWYDQTHTSGDTEVQLEAHRATQAWTEEQATWNNANAITGELSGTSVLVDDGDAGKTAAVGAWPASGNTAYTQYAVNQDYLFNKDTVAGDTYTWQPSLPEDGAYQVEAHYVPASDRATNAPYTVTYDGGSKQYLVNQQAGAAGVWKTLGTHPFKAGTLGKIVLGDGPASTTTSVIADAVRFTKGGVVTKQPGELNTWHTFPVTKTVQSWIDGVNVNNGFVIKAGDETANGPKGGPRYEGSEFGYGGETANYPRLVLTYGRQGVDLAAPTTIHDTGAELNWSGYTDPSTATGDDIVEYQVHRSISQTFTPSSATLVAPVASTVTSFTDTSASPTKADDPDPYGRAYYYMVAVKTKDGQVVAAPTQLVRLPKAGRTTKVLDATQDTTLSSARPTLTHDTIDDAGPKNWLSVGNNSATYGDTRAALKFPALGIPTTARVLDAKVRLWSTQTAQDTAGAIYELRPLTRDFDEATATWVKANATANWTAQGGDFGAVAADTGAKTNDPARHDWSITSLAQSWVTTPASQQGVVLKMADEVASQERTLFLSSEGTEQRLRPRIVVTYIDSTTESTYYAPQTPARMTPNTDYTVDFTLTNTTASTWNSADQVLTYKWTLPDGTDVTNGGNQVQTALPQDVTPGESVSLQAVVKTPINSDNGNKRTDYVLTWDVYNKTAGTWASGTAGIPGLKQNVAVEDPTSNTLGMEKFYSYAGTNTGANSSVMSNMASGNSVWSYDAFANPGRGLGTFARFAYNTLDTSDTVLGHGWSGQLAGPVRLGAPLDFHPNPHPTEIRLPDGDGTTHVFREQPDGTWKAPAGVHYKLTAKPGLDCTPLKDPIPDAWTMTRPDGTRFLFGCDGYMTSIVDKNGNTQTYTYEERKSNNKPTKFLRYITDPAGRQSLTVEYFSKADGLGPKITDHVKSMTEISGRKLTFEYSDKGLLTKLTDGAGSAQPKVFAFEYDATQGNKNVKLVKVTDPRGNATDMTYFAPQAGDDPKYHWWTKKITDRSGGDLGFAYKVDTANPKFTGTTVTDAKSHATAFVTDDFGRPVQTTNAKSQTTKMSWDADNNVTYVEENNGAKTAYCYDQKTGYPLWQRSAEWNKAGVPPGSACAPGTYPADAMKYEYQTRADGFSADLFRKTSLEGRAWQFGYDSYGNLTSVTDPKGVSTATAGDYTTSYTYDAYGQMLTATDAAGSTTTYSDFEPTGYPRTTRDALGKTSTTVYAPRGEVTSSTDELGHTVTQNYDVYGRPTDGRTPKDQAAGVYITNPAPVYDANDNVTTSTAPNGAVYSSVYDAGDQVASFTEPKDTPTGQARTTTYAYDTVGNQLSVTLPKGNLAGATAGEHTTTYTYDELNRPVTITDAFGNRTSASYDDVGNVSTVVDPLKNKTADATDFSASYTYDLDHKPVSTKDPAGYTRSTTYDKDGLTLSATDENGNTVLSTYDERGQVSQVRVPHSGSGGTITYNTTKYEYDAVGRQTTVITPRGTASGRADAFTAKTVYDELGRVKAKLSPYDPTDPVYNKPVQTDYTYDAVSRLTKVSAPPSKGETTRNDTTYQYFDNGWTKSSTDPWDIVAGYEYNTLGQQTRRTLTSAGGSSSRTMNWGYFPDGKLQTRSDTGVPVGLQVVLADNSDSQNVAKTGTWTTSSTGTGFNGHDYFTHAAGAGTDAVTWDTTIPEDGTYQVYVKYPAVTGAATTASYKVEHDGGSATKPVDQTKNAGAWVSLGSYAFKASGTGQRVSLTQNAGGTVVADAVKLVRDNSADTQLPPQSFGYTYDVNGNMTDLTDGSPGARYDAYAFTYDARDRLTQLQEKAAGNVKHTTGFGYDADSNIVSQTHDARSATFDYDVRGLLSKVVNKESASDPSPKTTSYTRTPAGQFATQTKGNNNVATFEYYLDSSLKKSSERTSGGTLVAEHSLTYDPNGNRTQDVSTTQNADNHGAYLSRTSTNVYTPRDQIASVRNSDGSSPQDYAYDDNGNITSQTVGSSATTNTYSRDRLLSSSTAAGTIKYNYDPFGRMDTVTGAGTVLEKFTYDGYDRIKSQQNNNGTGLVRTDFTYDAFGRTVNEVKGAGSASPKSTVFDYLAMGGAVVSETVDGILKKSYQYSPMGERLSQIVHGSGGSKDYTYYTYNPHSDVTALTDDQGNTKATYGYTAYGAQDDTQASGADKPGAGGAGAEPYNAYRFNSARVDTGSGNYNMGFRTYSTGMNRFLSRDMYNGALADMRLASDPTTGNRYAFAGGNPLSNVELDGHSWLSSNGRPSFAVDSAGTVTDLVDEMMNTMRDHYIRTTKVKGRTYVGAYDPATNRYVAGMSSNPFGCAERDCARKLGLPMDQVRFGNAISYQRPSKQPIIGVCENCQNDSARSQYPADAKWKPGARFDSGRAIHTSPGELAIPSRASTELVAVRSAQAAEAAAARTSSAGTSSGGSGFASKLSTAAKWGGRGLLALGVGVAAYEVWSAPDGQKGEAAVSAGSTLAGGLAGAWAGAKIGAAAGAAIGSIIPGAGTAVGGVVGGVVGGLVGGIAGSYVGSKAGDFFNSLW